MKANSLQSIFEKVPQTKSYTPSSFIKGFIPKVLLQNGRQSPVSPNDTKQKANLSSEAELNLKRTLDNVALYRNPLPPSFPNIVNRSTKRPITIKIVKNNFQENNKRVETVSVSNKGSNGQISRTDTLKTVKSFLSRTLKGYDRRKEDKTKGSMFINDLWSKGYEKRIIEACQMEDELKHENRHIKKALGDNFEELSNLYEKRMNDSEIKEAIEDIRSQRRVTFECFFGPVSISPLKTSEDSADLRDQSPVTTMLDLKSPTESNAASQTNLGRKPTRSLNNLSIFGKIRAESNKPRRNYLSRIQGESLKVRNEDKLLLKINLTKNEETDSGIGLSKEDKIGLNLNLKSSPTSILKKESSIASNFARNKKRYAESQRRVATEETMDENPFEISKSLSPIARVHKSSLKNQLSLSFSRKIADICKDKDSQILNETNEAVIDLIQRCDTQLKEKVEYLEIRKSKSTKRRNPEELNKTRKIEEEHKEKLIEYFKFSLKKQPMRAFRSNVNC